MRSGSGSPRPRLKPWYRLATCERGLTARFGSSVLLFEGAAARELLPGLLPLLDGTRTVEELADCLGPRTRPAVERVVEMLDAHGLLLDTEPPAGAAGELLAATAWKVRDLAEARVAVLGEGETAAEAARLLRASGVGHVDTDWDAELVVAAPDDDVDAQLRDWNAVALDRRTPWLPITPFDGTIAAVGPLVVPGETACHACLTVRRSADPHGALERPLYSRYPSSPALRTMSAAVATTTAVRWLATGDAPVVGAILALEYETQTVTRHAVFRVPRCPACSALATTATLVPWGRDDALAA
ncbi:MAG: TOMM precursor leader peptide-binding protein [Gaiellaceae bacterium]